MNCNFENILKETISIFAFLISKVSYHVHHHPAETMEVVLQKQKVIHIAS